MTLFLSSFLLTVVLSIVVGLFAGLHPDSVIDRVITIISITLNGIPSVLVGIILILLFSVVLGWLPSSGVTSMFSDTLWDRMIHLILPTVTVMFSHIGSFSRFIQEGMKEELDSYYVYVARANHMSKWDIYRGAMKNALVPFVNYVGTHVPSFFSGFVVIETVFAYPGLGNMIVNAIPVKDYPVLMGGILVTGVVVIVSMLIVDLIDLALILASEGGDQMKKKVRKNGLWVLLFLVIVLLCITAPLYAVYSPTEVDLGSVLQKPNAAHWFGTDSSGRDVFTRTMYGGMVSLAVAAASSLCALLFGIVYGGISGYVGGKLDAVMMRMVDIAYAMPSTIVALAFQMIFPNKVLGLVIVMSLTSWMTMARVIRARFQELKKENYIMLAEGFNIPRYVILFHHMVRNSFSSIIIIATFTFASAIVTETSLSYLGVGIPIGIPSWGNMINGIQSYVLSGKWWIVLPPGVMIILSSICVNYVGEYLKEKYVS